ncbi:MAG: hypothetical protein SF339_01460 [Blastocatellia bacterium]|nr:hypothetical protein [Blastocatellia bacterium]
MTMVLDDLLANLIDYAGLFPPAALEMRTAVRNYAEYRRGEHAGWLGRFVVPASRLAEFEQAAEGVEKSHWRLSALGGGDPTADLAEIARFNDCHAAGEAQVDTIEFKAATSEEILSSMARIPASLTAYIEIPIVEDPTRLIETISDRGARAKVRTGGVTADAFPASTNLARFIVLCSDEDVPFKATAGLHHPMRGVHRLTYEPDSPSAMMHGFLNVFLAAAFAQNGIGLEQLAELLEERSPEAFRFEQGSVTWRGEMAVRAHIRNTRSLLAVSFGSCSFLEPIEDLKKMGLR